MKRGGPLQRKTPLKAKADAPKRSSVVYRQERRVERLEHNAETGDLRAQAMERSGGKCECCRECEDPAQEWDHFWGRRGETQTLESTWMLSALHHREKTESQPNRRYWLGLFLAHCERHGYTAEAQRARDMLDAAKMKAALPF